MKPKTTRCNNKRRLYANELDGEVAPSLSAKVQIRAQRFGEVCVQERLAIAGRFKLGRPLVYTRHTPYMCPFSTVSSEDLPSPSAHRWSAPAAEGGRQHVVALVGRAFVCVVYFSFSSSRLAVSFALPLALIVCGAS